MLTLAALLENTPNPVRSRANSQCSGVLTIKGQEYAEKLRGPKKDRFVELRFGVSCLTGVRKATVRFHGGGVIDKKSPVWVSCSCPYWLYYCEVAVTKAGSSSVIFSNGEAPKVRNASGTPYLCKHLVRIATHGLKAIKKSNLPEVVERELKPRQKSSVNFSRPSLVSIPDEVARILGRKV